MHILKCMNFRVAIYKYGDLCCHKINTISFLFTSMIKTVYQILVGMPS